MQVANTFPEVIKETSVVVAYDNSVSTTKGNTTGWWLVVCMPVHGKFIEGDAQLLPCKPTNKQIRQAVKALKSK